MKLKIDINCDLGESYGAFKVGDDPEIMPHITSANIACGFHAGDPMAMAQTVALAKKHRVAIGAHPSFPDLIGFGRREMQLTREEVKNYIIYQVSALQGFAEAAHLTLQHVKPHGALYNMAAKDEELARAIVDGIKTLNPNLIVFAQPKSALAKAAAKARLHVAYEFFADRNYNPDGSLVSRKKPTASIQNPQKMVERAVNAITNRNVLTVNGEAVKLGEVHTICVHSDNPAAVKLARALHKGLEKAGIEVKPVGSFI
ncbi:MAG TPA: 5-oxoprolinase subunit PxpA [Candidatus Bathyarchaeia archaeon]|nr:5-oxoprolinase subunit PxpA [Candidatus Bathyarchaeia archaeon]